MLGERVAVLVAAGGAAWEAEALNRLASAGPGVVLLKRCVDLNDLLATASTGQARAAVVDRDLPGLDVDSVAMLRRCAVGVVLVEAIGGADDRGDLGAQKVLPASGTTGLVEAVLAAATGVPDEPARPEAAATDDQEWSPVDPAEPGRLIAVWGPTGAPGRTTVAVGLGAELAHRDQDAFVIDADSFGGAVAAHLGVLDEMSGLLAAARLANAGQLDAARLATLARGVGPRLRVLTGLPRADRWSEVRDTAFEQILDLARSLAGHVLVDTGFCLEEDGGAAYGGGPGRHQMTLTTLAAADEILVVGSADPVGLARLARGLVELLETVPGCSVRVAVNRSRSSLGWGEREVRAMIEGFVTPASLHFLPEDRAAADRAVVGGKSLVELGDSALRRSVAQLADAVTGVSARGARRRNPRLRRRRAGTAR